MIQKAVFERHFWRVAILVFVAIVTINYFPVLTGKVPFPRDIVMRHSAWDGQPRSGPPQQVGQLIDIVAMFYPFRALLNHSTESWEIPLWNPHIMGGAPFQANAQSAVFGPLSFLYYVLPLKLAWTVNLMLRMLLAGIFMTLFARRIGASATGAIVSGLIFALCGFTVQWQGESNGESSIWLPLMCYATYRLHQSPDRRSVAIAAVAFTAPLLSGHPETAAHSTFVATALALTLWLRRDSPQFLATFIASGLLAAGLGAVQLLPTVEWMGQLDLQVEGVQPGLSRHQGQGFFSRDILRDPSSALVSIPEGSSYVGMLALLAAPFALFYRPRRDVWFLLAAAIIATMAAFGIPPVRWLVEHLPIIKAMKNGRLTLVTDFALAGLAGIGITVIENFASAMTRHAKRRAATLLGVTFLALSFCVWEVHRATFSPVEFWRSPWGSLVFLVGGIAVVIAALTGVLRRTLSFVVLAFVAVEMVTFSYGFLGFTPAAEVFPPAPVFDFIKEHSGPNVPPFRVAKDRVPIPHDVGIIFGFEAADGYDLTTARTRMFMTDFMENREDGVMFLAEKILAAPDRRLDMVNVKYLMVTVPGPQFDMISARTDHFQPVFAKQSVAVFENRNALPRAFGVPVSGIEIVSDSAAQMARMKDPSFDPERTVLFAERPDGFHVEPSTTNALPASVEVVERGTNHVRLRTDIQTLSVIVISQMYYPGWHAAIDGVEVPVYPVNLALTGVIAPANTRDILLTFRPLTFRVGAIISLCSLVIAALAFFWKRFASRHLDC